MGKKKNGSCRTIAATLETQVSGTNGNSTDSDSNSENIISPKAQKINNALKENVKAKKPTITKVNSIHENISNERETKTINNEQEAHAEASTRKSKIRIVPLEKLLAKPPTDASENSSARAPRQCKNVSIVELDDTDTDVSTELTNNKKTIVIPSDTSDSESEDQCKKLNKSRLNKKSKLEELLVNRQTKGRSNSSPRAARQCKTVTVGVLGSTDEGDNSSKILQPLAYQNSHDKKNIQKSDTSESELEKPLKRRNQSGLNNRAKRLSRSSTSSASGSIKTASRNHNSSTDYKGNNTSALKNGVCSSLKPRRFVVRVRRVKLPQKETPEHKTEETTQTKRKMSADDEEATTSATATKRRQKSISEADSDENEELAAEIEENSDAERNEEEEVANSSDSEVIPQRKKRNFKRKPNSGDDNGDAPAVASNNESSDFEPEEKKKKKRRRIKKNSSGDSDADGDDEKNKNKRKHIRKIIKTKDLDVSTKEAAKEEEDRRKRIEERQKLYNRIFEKSENVEISELVLDFESDTKKALLQVDKGLLKKLKPHQVAGVKFMWDACFETLQDSEEKPGSGCILAHCMGLGKTLQVVTLTHTLLSNTRRTSVERVLIISPLSTVNNWAREFVHWMSFANKRNIEVYDISRYKDKPTRIFKLSEWFEEGGVCILGYDMYRILANEKAKGLRKKQREQLQQALVDPGPDLVVCDEGHLLKNEKTSISKAVTRMRTKRRIVLTGTPLQNNLKEYYCMIQFVKPNLLGTYKEYMNRFVNPISNGQYTDSTERDLRLMKHRSHILHKLLEGCIQRRDYSVLAPYLPPKHEYVVYTTLSELQQQLYEFYMTTYRDQGSSDINGKGARLFQDFQDLRRIWTHPMNLRVNSDNVIAKRLLSNDDSDMEAFICDESEEEEAVSNSSDSCESFKSDASGTLADTAGGSKVHKTRKTRNGVRSGLVDSDSDVELLGGGASVQKDDPSEWWKVFVEEKELNNINHSPKLLILMRLLQECEAIGDKLLVFSQSLQSLDVIEHFLSLVDSNTKGYEFEGDVGNFKGCWTNGEDYFRLDGSCTVEHREAMCKKFNNATNLRARLFLISTRAGGLGINLVAANRVVIFDVSWNPSHDTQSIFRVYRFGQVKPCYIYRLIAMGTMEQKVYDRQVAKQATAKRVIDEQQISRHYNQTDLMELYTYELKPSVEREMPILPKDRLFAELLTEHEKLIFKYHEHDSLLEQEEHENLTEEERKSAWAEYEAEKTRTVQTAQYMSYDRGAFGTTMVNQFGNASGSVTSNKIFGFRSDILLQLLNMKISKDHPELTQNQVIQLVPGYLQQLYNEMNNGDPTMYKDLLQLHSTIVHPSGMYMNPLLYANQNPSAAGYHQTSTAPQPQAPPPPSEMSSNAPGFEADKVYEID